MACTKMYFNLKHSYKTEIAPLQNMISITKSIYHKQFDDTILVDSIAICNLLA